MKHRLSFPVASSLAAAAILYSVCSPRPAIAQFESKVSPTTPVADQGYGFVALDPDDGALMVVGAGTEDFPVSPLDAGAAYVYRFDGSTWIEEQRLESPTPDTFDRFGDAVAVDDDVIMVGEPNDDLSGASTGSVHVFRYDGAAWNLEETLVSSTPFQGNTFGASVDLVGDLAVVSSANDNEMGNGAGAAFVFRYANGTWTEEAKLTASDADVVFLFGTAVATDGNRIVVSSLQATVDGLANAGAAYVFAWDGSSWTEEARVVAPFPRSSSNYGVDIDVDGEWMLVGHNIGGFPPNTGNGAAHAYRHDGGGWQFHSTLRPAAGDTAGFYLFGSSVALSGERAVVGATNWFPPGGDASGKAYGFSFDDQQNEWLDDAEYVPFDAGRGDNFGASVSLSGDALAIGSPDNEVIAGSASGAVYVYGMAPAGTGRERLELTDRFTRVDVYPNPFNVDASLVFEPAIAGEVSVELVDLLGRNRALLFEGYLTPGDARHIPIPGAGLAAGTYVVRFKTAQGVGGRMISLIR